MEALTAIFLAVTIYGGFVLPLIGLVLSWREWLRIKHQPKQRNWRRIATIAALSFLTVCILPWGYAVFRDIHDNYPYTLGSAQIGRWSSLLVFGVALFAEGKVRRYLLVGAVGLLFFFAVTIGELP